MATYNVACFRRIGQCWNSFQPLKQMGKLFLFYKAKHPKDWCRRSKPMLHEDLFLNRRKWVKNERANWCCSTAGVWKLVHWSDKTGEQTCISISGKMRTVQGDKQAIDTPKGALCPPHHTIPQSKCEQFSPDSMFEKGYLGFCSRSWWYGHFKEALTFAKLSQTGSKLFCCLARTSVRGISLGEGGRSDIAGMDEVWLSKHCPVSGRRMSCFFLSPCVLRFLWNWLRKQDLFIPPLSV